MEKISTLIEIAEYLGLDNITAELNSIELRSKQENANLVLPLVGEFSSGKTTLINSLTDSKKLETATRPTTATIYEVHFGSDSCAANVVNEKGELINVPNIAELKNEDLADAKVVTVFDTSTRVPSTTILVDTPGLSSPDPKHKQTLVNFLPLADAIILVIDINQQVTRSLTDFIETMKLSQRRIYLVLTKSDTKSKDDIEAAKVYISKNCQVPVQQVAVVSAATNSLEELYALFDNIQKDKKEILKRVDGQRVKNIVNTLTEQVEDLMNASATDKDLDEAIRRCQYELDKIKRNIDRLVESTSEEIEEYERTVTRRFEDTISSKLSTLVTGKSNNFDAEAVSAINTTATLLVNEYKNGIQSLLREKARSVRGTDNEIPLNSLEELDMADVQVQGLSYNLDLNTMGHEYDGAIKVGVIAAAAVGAVAIAASTVGAAGAAAADSAIELADTAADVGSIITTTKAVSKIEKAERFVASAAEKYATVETTNQNVGQQMGRDKGMIDSLVGFATDKMMGKPQRARAIRNYIDSSLAPEFKSTLNQNSQRLVSSIRDGLQNEASILIGQKTEALNQLKTEKEEKKEAFNQRIEQLRVYKTNLLTF
ncbi:dynamin family protein [Hoylesella loescheii]|uniref:dynamin family protein n=1 Tax=Hoylesella loescheii TaxID=840 RepID=UPI00248E80C6|nr:dynamin family protein [Hoylesella loescheii]